MNPRNKNLSKPANFWILFTEVFMRSVVKNIFIVFISIFSFSTTCFSQDKKMDSLNSVLKISKEDTSKVNVLNDLCKLNWKKGNYDEATNFANSALKLSGKLNFKKGIGKAYNNIGIILWYQGNYPEAMKNHEAALKIWEELGEKSGLAISYHNIGNIYMDQGNYADAIKNHLKALSIREEIGDKPGIGSSYGNLGVIYDLQGDYSKALENYQASLKIKKEINDKFGIAISYNNIGIVYKKEGKNDEALENYLAALKIREEIGDKRGIAASYNNIGNLYSDLGNQELALDNFTKSLSIKIKIGDKSGIAESYINIGSVYLNQKKFPEAKIYFHNALDYSLELGSWEHIKDSYHSLAELDSAVGNFSAAFDHYKLYRIYTDSIFNDDNKQKAMQSEMQYTFDKKSAIEKEKQDKKDVIVQKDKERQKIILIVVVTGLIVVVLFLVFLVNRFNVIQRQKKIIELQKHEVEEQKSLAEDRKEIVEEKNKQITDSITYARRLQRAILPSDEEMAKALPGLFLLYKPKDIVAGDFYWMETLGDRVLIAAADSTGHGVPGALVSIVCSNALNRTVNEYGITEPGKILGKTRDLVLETFSKSMTDVQDGMDISLASINKKTGEMKWSGANNPLCYFQNGVLKEIAASKQSIGKNEIPVPYPTHIVQLNKGDTIYLFTDGYCDQFGGPKGKKFKYKKLMELLSDIQSLEPEEQKIKLNDSFESWKGSLEQVDDVCLIGIRF